jgi:DNA-3-methyladenine glycosylase II
MWHAAERQLATDPAMARLISRIGRCRLRPNRAHSPYEALVRAIAYQQLHARAAEAILGRFLAHFGNESFPSPEAVLATERALLRTCGFSEAKITAILDICAYAQVGTVPTRRRAHRLSDAELIDRMTAIRGVGRWTVEMLLIFTLGRPDVLPADDFGVRQGFRALHGLDKAPSPRALREAGAVWAPWRSVAAWYLWRAADADKRGELDAAL